MIEVETEVVWRCIKLYIKNDLDFKRRDDLCDQNVECIWIELTLPNKRPIFVCAVYNPNGKDGEFSKKLLTYE